MRLIDVDKLKQYIDDCECCEKCDTKFFKCYECCELPDFLTPQWERVLNEQPTVERTMKYTNEELSVFAHGISLSLLSNRSAQYWRYDADTAIEIEFLERLYDKVVADMRGEQDERFNQQTGGD